jgi:hypothetical protein
MDLERIRILARWYLLQEGLMAKEGKMAEQPQYTTQISDIIYNRIYDQKCCL